MACNQGFSEHLKLLEKGLKSSFLQLHGTLTNGLLLSEIRRNLS